MIQSCRWTNFAAGVGGEKMSSGDEGEESAIDPCEDGTASTAASDLSSNDNLMSPPPVNAIDQAEKLPVVPDTPTTPNTPVSLGNNHVGLLSPGLGSPGAQSASSGSGSGVDPVHDLPAELLAVGWRRFWSRRENRPYFYNKLTTESRWETPPLPGQVSTVLQIPLKTFVEILDI